MAAYVYAYQIKERMHRLLSQERKEACQDINQKNLSLGKAMQKVFSKKSNVPPPAKDNTQNQAIV